MKQRINEPDFLYRADRVLSTIDQLNAQTHLLKRLFCDDSKRILARRPVLNYEATKKALAMFSSKTYRTYLLFKEIENEVNEVEVVGKQIIADARIKIAHAGVDDFEEDDEDEEDLEFEEAEPLSKHSTLKEHVKAGR